MSKSLAIITARGGSKRIPRKNIKPFLGDPIIAYSIRAALESGVFASVMVSTDDSEIADVARRFGAEVPFFRSPANSDDHSGTAEVLREVLLQYRSLGQEFEHFCCIYPTAPFVTATRLRQAMDLLQARDVDCVLPVVRYGYPVQRSLKIDSDGLTRMKWPENYQARSQDLEPVYHDAGQFYCLKTDALLAQMKLFAERTLPLELSELEVQDIDNEVDWTLAELKYRLVHCPTAP